MDVKGIEAGDEDVIKNERQLIYERAIYTEDNFHTARNDILNQ